MSADIPRELVEQFARGNGVIFVGAGLSMGAGLPGWNALLTPLADSIRLPQDRRADLLKVAQYYENARGRQALIAYLQEQTDTTGRKPIENHRRLARLGVRTWVTTNYDDLIEQTLRKGGERTNVVVRDQDLPYVSADAVTLLKLHGDRSQPDSIVVTEQDYRTYFRRFPRVKDKLTGLLLEKTFLFVGYSTNDPDFSQLRAEIAYDLRQHARMAHAILFDADEFTVADLRAQNVQVINVALNGQLEHSERLGELLDELVAQVNRCRHQTSQDARAAMTITPPPDAADVRGLLEAMGYRICDSRSVGADIYFLCEAKWGAEIRQEVVHSVGETPTASDIAALNDAVVSHGAARGVLLTRHLLPAPLRDLARQRERIQSYALDEFTDRLADFRPHLERLIADYEASEIPQYYVPLSVEAVVDEDREPRVFKPIESFVDTWLAEPGRNHLSILGDFGSGKTWFCQRYAYLAAKRYLADPAHNRIPILITLRDYSRAYDVEQLITDAVANRYRVGLAAGYKTFARLNAAGHLLLMFDGFDEMERRVSDYRTTVDNFWELAKVIDPLSKVLLTCRTAYFRHRGEEEETLTPRPRLVSMVSGDKVIDLRARQGFEVAHLLDLDADDVRLALHKRLPGTWQAVYQKVQGLTNLRDLASRPVLLDMIVKTLPQIQNPAQINQATLYETYVDALLKRRWSEDTDYIPPEERRFFVQELAWEMYTAQKLVIPFSEFPERVTKHFGLSDDPARAAFFERDLRTQSYLVRDEAGNYRFAHKSFVEYFVARKLTTLISRPHYNVAAAMEAWGSRTLDPEIRDFLTHMFTEETSLWRLIDRTRGRAVAEVGYAGGNAATVLHRRGASFVGKSLNDTVLRGADLRKSDLRNANLQGAWLGESNLSGCHLTDTDLRKADLSDIHIEEMGEVESVAWHPSGELLASGGGDSIVRIWDTGTWSELVCLRDHRAAVNELCWSSDGRLLASADRDSRLFIWNRAGFGLEGALSVDDRVEALGFSPDAHHLWAAVGNRIMVWDESTGWSLGQTWQGGYSSPRIFCLGCSHSGEYLASGGADNSISIWCLQDGDRWHRPWKTWSAHLKSVISVSYSPDDRFLLSGSIDGVLKLWDLGTGDSRVLLKHPSHIRGVFSPNGRHIASTTSAPIPEVWLLDGSTSEIEWRQRGHTKKVTQLSFSPDSKRVATGSEDATIRVWDTDPASSRFGTCISTLEMHMKCDHARIRGAYGLQSTAPDGRTTLEKWLVTRGAIA